MYIYAKNSDFLDPIGIHFHIGSQLTDLKPIKESSKIVADLVKSLKAIDIDIKFFDIGGGLGVRYKDEKLITPEDYAKAVLESIKGLDVTIICEPGRYMVANESYLVTTVLYEKENGGKRFIIVDGAMNDLLRPSLYNAYHKAELFGKERENSGEADIVGPICESGDFLAKNVQFPSTNSGDIIIFHSAGAYGFTMSSNYNTRPRAIEISYKNGEYRIIRDREKFEDLIALEKSYLKD
jgi:diaminopimelate decarboxylase